MKIRIRTIAGVLFLALACASAQATTLLFDITGTSNGSNMNQGYGDAVTATTMGLFGYAVGSEGFTPNVQATYGTDDPSIWTTGYGNLTNILYENQDSTGILTISLVADAGFTVALHQFDLAAFNSSFSSDPIVQRITVTDGGSTTYYSLINGTVSETAHTTIDFSPNPIVGSTLVITVDARNLGGLNDDIGVDNIRFSQAPVPEPGTVATLGLGLLGWLRRRHRKAKA